MNFMFDWEVSTATSEILFFELMCNVLLTI